MKLLDYFIGATLASLVLGAVVLFVLYVAMQGVV